MKRPLTFLPIAERCSTVLVMLFISYPVEASLLSGSKWNGAFSLEQTQANRPQEATALTRAVAVPGRAPSCALCADR
jgi:hypothetical protein